MRTPLLDRLPDLLTIFLSIVLQSLPFVLIGVFAAALAELYLTDQVLARWLPRGRGSTLVLASLVGLVVPVCDCGVIPFARRLIARGVPVYAALSLILAAPVVNPVVVVSTAVAFQGNWRVVALRRSMSLSVALGALFTAATQTFVSRSLLNTVGADRLASILVMMPLATILSICSEADAFVARAFANVFSVGSVFAFMVIGQVVDLRNGLLLFRTLGPRYVALIVVTSYLLVFAEALLLNSILRL